MQKHKHKIQQHKNTMITWFSATFLLYKSELQFSKLGPKLTIY